MVDAVVRNITTLYFPSTVQADLTVVNGIDIINFKEEARPVVATLDEHGNPISRPQGPLIAACDLGSNSSFLLFAPREIWLLNEVR